MVCVCVFFLKNLFPRHCWTVLIMMMNQKLEKKQRRMKCRHSPPCNPLIYYIFYSMFEMQKSFFLEMKQKL